MDFFQLINTSHIHVVQNYYQNTNNTFLLETSLMDAHIWKAVTVDDFPNLINHNFCEARAKS